MEETINHHIVEIQKTQALLEGLNGAKDRGQAQRLRIDYTKKLEHHKQRLRQMGKQGTVVIVKAEVKSGYDWEPFMTMYINISEDDARTLLNLQYQNGQIRKIALQTVKPGTIYLQDFYSALKM